MSPRAGSWCWAGGSPAWRLRVVLWPTALKSPWSSGAIVRGGRATTHERNGFAIDSAPHLVSTRDMALLQLVRDVGLATRMLPLRPVALAQLHAGTLEPIEPTGTKGVRGLPGVGWREGLRVHRLGRLLRKFEDILVPSRPLDGVRMDDRSIADYVRTYFGTSVLERWVEPYVMADAGGAEVADASPSVVPVASGRSRFRADRHVAPGRRRARRCTGRCGRCRARVPGARCRARRETVSR